MRVVYVCVCVSVFPQSITSNTTHWYSLGCAGMDTVHTEITTQIDEPCGFVVVNLSSTDSRQTQDGLVVYTWVCKCVFAHL